MEYQAHFREQPFAAACGGGGGDARDDDDADAAPTAFGHSVMQGYLMQFRLDPRKACARENVEKFAEVDTAQNAQSKLALRKHRSELERRVSEENAPRPSSPVEDVDPDATAGDGAPSRAYWRQLSVAVRSGRFKDDDARHAVPAQLQRTASYR